MEQVIFNYLLEKGCCKVCTLRYLHDKIIDFNDINGYIEKKGYLRDVTSEDLSLKKFRSNPCIVCLDLLEESIINDVVDQVSVSEVQKYDTTVFTCSISIPAAILIREHAIRIMLSSAFPNYYDDDIEELSLNKAWKFIMKNRLSERLEMSFNNNCDFSINIVMDYEDNNKELLVLNKFNLNKRGNVDLYSRKFISNLLANTSLEEYRNVITILPEIPTKSLCLKLIECKHNSIYFAGRYCKFSRELSQSPWIVDGIKTMESSVEEIIFEQIHNLFSISMSHLKFSSSGREDCDVRCLGKGRPFYIEILDPKKTIFTFDEFRKLESKINESPLIKIRDLQSVKRCELIKIKEGEQMKTKDYVALCITKSIVTQDHIDKINNIESLTIDQKTPIRVLHRRPLAVRTKKIHNIKAELIPGKDNMFILHAVTEAGTYIKEFVHGDFGRTKPSIGDIISDEVDIVALDVVAVNLDWPKEIIV